jgi:uracil-DNA glycosylase
LLVLGSGPTRDEVKAGEQLSGMMGREMSEALLEAGIQKERLLVVNAFACTPNEPQRDTENRAATLACRPLVRYYTNKLPPETPTLLCGKWAMLSLTGTEKGMFATRGFRDDKWTLQSPLKKDEKED